MNLYDTPLNLYDLERQIERQLNYEECWIESDPRLGGYQAFCRDAKGYWRGFVFEMRKEETAESFLTSMKEMNPTARPIDVFPGFCPYASELGMIHAMLDVLRELGDTRQLERRNPATLIHAREVRELLAQVRARFKQAMTPMRGTVTYSDGTTEPLVFKECSDGIVSGRVKADANGEIKSVAVRQTDMEYMAERLAAERAAAEKLGTIPAPRLTEKHLPGMELTAPTLDKKKPLRLWAGQPPDADEDTPIWYHEIPANARCAASVAPQDKQNVPPAKGCACANPRCTWRGSFYCTHAE